MEDKILNIPDIHKGQLEQDTTKCIKDMLSLRAQERAKKRCGLHLCCLSQCACVIPEVEKPIFLDGCSTHFF